MAASYTRVILAPGRWRQGDENFKIQLRQVAQCQKLFVAKLGVLSVFPRTHGAVVFWKLLFAFCTCILEHPQT